MRWISSEGGPLLLLPRSLLSLWSGCIQRSAEIWARRETETDYDRACKVVDYTGLIHVDGQEALVLGEHMQTTWVSQPAEQGGMLVQWQYANDEDSISRCLRLVPSTVFSRTSLVFHVNEPIVYLFDAARSGSSLQQKDALIVELRPGTYHVRTGRYEPDTTTSVILHRLSLG